MNFSQINCNNRTCELSAACRNYMNNSGDEIYLRPMITFNGKRRIFQCDWLLPHNIDSIKQKYERDTRRQNIKLNLAYKIIEQFGDKINKEKLMKDLKTLMA